MRRSAIVGETKLGWGETVGKVAGGEGVLAGDLWVGRGGGL